MRMVVLTKKALIISIVVIACILLAVILVTSMGEGNSSPALNRAGNGAESGRESNGGEIALEQYTLDVMAGKHKELPVYSVGRDDKKIALTIDAAWEDDKTPFILEELEREGIHATFFVCGFWVEKYPDNIKAIAAAGHELGNHSLTHPHMSKLSAQQIRNELTKFDDLMESVTGSRTKLFRAPYGEYNDNVILTVREIGYTPVQWDIDTIDWKEERSAQTILDTVLGKLHSGCIILCHNNGFKIKEYLPTLIKTAKSQGYEFVTLSELLLQGETIIDVNGVQHSKS